MRRAVLLTTVACCMIGLHSLGDDQQPSNVDAVVTLLELVINADEETAKECLTVVTRAVQNGQLSDEQVAAIRDQLAAEFKPILEDDQHAMRFPVALLTASWNDPQGVQLALRLFNDASADNQWRVEALKALIASGRDHLVQSVADVILGRRVDKDLRIAVIESLSGVKDPEMAKFLVDNYSTWERDVQPRVIEVLTQRPAWSAALLKAIVDKKIDKDRLNLNQIARVASFKDDDVQALVTQVYGQVRSGQRSDRRNVINRMRNFLLSTSGDPERGQAAFKKVCAQCHKIYGEGAEVGPDITRNGRNSWYQMLTNVFDPSAVIGPGYQARILVTDEGRVLTGLAIEESDQRVILKLQGGKIETIPRDQIEEYKVSEVSLMPEQLEKQLTPQEISDLFAFLSLDKPPSDPTASYLPGAPHQDE